MFSDGVPRHDCSFVSHDKPGWLTVREACAREWEQAQREALPDSVRIFVAHLPGDHRCKRPVPVAETAFLWELEDCRVQFWQELIDEGESACLPMVLGQNAGADNAPDYERPTWGQAAEAERPRQRRRTE